MKGADVVLIDGLVVDGVAVEAVVIATTASASTATTTTTYSTCATTAATSNCIKHCMILFDIYIYETSYDTLVGYYSANTTQEQQD